MMKEQSAAWTELQKRVERVTTSCTNFGKAEPKFTFYEKLKDELDEASKSWAGFDEFQNELNGFCKEEWLTFRKKGYFAF